MRLEIDKDEIGDCKERAGDWRFENKTPWDLRLKNMRAKRNYFRHREHRAHGEKMKKKQKKKFVLCFNTLKSQI